MIQNQDKNAFQLYELMMILIWKTKILNTQNLEIADLNNLSYLNIRLDVCYLVYCNELFYNRIQDYYLRTEHEIKIINNCEIRCIKNNQLLILFYFLLFN